MPTLSIPQAAPAWTQPTAPSSDIAPWVELTLNRNLADFPFPSCASEDELRAIEARVLDALDKTGHLSHGQYFPMHELSTLDQYLLAERRMAVEDLMFRSGPRGVFVREDQGLVIMINGLDHISIRRTLSGHAGEAGWQELNNLDNLLSRLLDFAFDSRRGYLTSVLDNVGTGLRVRALLHLPALQQSGGILAQANAAARHGLLICGVRKAGARPAPPAPVPPDFASPPVSTPDWAGESLYTDTDGALFGPGTETLGELYLVCSHATLGRSEPELLFGVQHTAAELHSAEERARAQMLSTNRIGLEDRVGRAIGIAQGARLVGFEEGYALLSSLRLGAACHLPQTPPLAVLNELLITSQGAHLAKSLPGMQGALELNEARATRFRQLFPAR